MNPGGWVYFKTPPQNNRLSEAVWVKPHQVLLMPPTVVMLQGLASWGHPLRVERELRSCKPQGPTPCASRRSPSLLPLRRMRNPLSITIQFLLDCEKIPEKSNLKKEKSVLAQDLRTQSIMLGESWQREGEAAAHGMPMIRKQRQMHAGVQLAPSFLFTQDYSLWNEATHVQRGSSLKTPS